VGDEHFACLGLAADTVWPASRTAGESELWKQPVSGAVRQTELAKLVGLFRKTRQASLLGQVLLSYR